MKTYFQQSIEAKGLVPAGFDARHIEGYVRLNVPRAYATTSQLSWAEIRREVRLSIACIKEGGVEAAERNAQSFGL